MGAEQDDVGGDRGRVQVLLVLDRVGAERAGDDDQGRGAVELRRALLPRRLLQLCQRLAGRRRGSARARSGGGWAPSGPARAVRAARPRPSGSGPNALCVRRVRDRGLDVHAWNIAVEWTRAAFCMPDMRNVPLVSAYQAKRRPSHQGRPIARAVAARPMPIGVQGEGAGAVMRSPVPRATRTPGDGCAFRHVAAGAGIGGPCPATTGGTGPDPAGAARSGRRRELSPPEDGAGSSAGAACDRAAGWRAGGSSRRAVTGAPSACGWRGGGRDRQRLAGGRDQHLAGHPDRGLVARLPSSGSGRRWPGGRRGSRGALLPPAVALAGSAPTAIIPCTAQAVDCELTPPDAAEREAAVGALVLAQVGEAARAPPGVAASPASPTPVTSALLGGPGTSPQPPSSFCTLAEPIERPVEAAGGARRRAGRRR